MVVKKQTIIRRGIRRDRPGRTPLTTLLLPLLLTLIFSACLNPFAPSEGGLSSGLYEDQASVGGLLRNFRTAYSLRDSLRYADLIADEFVFQYYNDDLLRYDQWFRDTELRATGGLMRSYDLLDVRWGPLYPEELDTFARPDTTVEFTINFSLSVGHDLAINGFARFRARAGQDGRFRFISWRDDF